MSTVPPFSEDFLSTIVNVSWGSGDILWINASVTGVAYTNTFVDPRYSVQMQSLVYPALNANLLTGGIGETIENESGQTPGVDWCYAPIRQDRRTVIPAPSVEVIDTARVRFALTTAMNLGLQEEDIDFNDPVSVLHFAQASNASRYYVIVAVLSSHIATGNPLLQTELDVQSNTFFNLTNIKNKTKAKFFTFRIFGTATFSGEGGHSCGIHMTTWARSQATAEIPFREIKKFPITPDGEPDEDRFLVDPVSTLQSVIDGNTTPAGTYQVNLETFEITQLS